jgi:hypothetical protein
VDAVAATATEKRKEMSSPIENGIAKLVGAVGNDCETKVRTALAKVRSASELAQLYVDPEDRRRVRDRELISATLNAIVSLVEAKHLKETDGSVNVLLVDDIMSELAWALRQFDHDRARIDGGMKPELVLKPVARESIDQKGQISASRKLLIHWLVAVQLWDKDKDRRFRTMSELLDLAAKLANTTAGRLKTERKNFSAGQASRAELELYHDLIDDVTGLAALSKDVQSPFALIMPSVLALSV